MATWADNTYDIDRLLARAESTPDCYHGSVLDWLKAIRVVDRSVTKVKPVIPRIDADGSRIKAGYLAACASEWDSWGESRPIDFVKAIRLECRGNTGRDLIAETLTALGRAAAVQEA